MGMSSKNSATRIDSALAISWSVEALTRLVPRSYFWICTFQVASYSGVCNGTVTMTQKQGHRQVVLRQAGVGPGHCEAGNIYLAHADFGTIPNAPGAGDAVADDVLGDAKAVMKVSMTIATP